MRCHFCARRWHRTRRPRLTPSPCSPTGSDALVGILMVAKKEEPSSKRGHGDACASAGGVRTATLARAPRRPLREGRAPAVRVRRPAFGTGQTSTVPTSYMLGPEVHASVTCVGFTNDPNSLICRKATRLVSPWRATRPQDPKKYLGALAQWGCDCRRLRRCLLFVLCAM